MLQGAGEKRTCATTVKIVSISANDLAALLKAPKNSKSFYRGSDTKIKFATKQQARRLCGVKLLFSENFYCVGSGDEERATIIWQHGDFCICVVFPTAGDMNSFSKSKDCLPKAVLRIRIGDILLGKCNPWSSEVLVSDLSLQIGIFMELPRSTRTSFALLSSI
jgi:hypothetical protein